MPGLNTFPISMKVRDRRVVIAGGGVEAVNKARLLGKSTARLVVVARDFTGDFAGIGAEFVERRFEPTDLDGAAMVFVADEGPDSDAVIAAARERGIPLNVVDRPELCDFYTPAIVDRAPISVAISSEGDAPVMARLIRARIEAMLSLNTGAIAQLAGELRDRVARLLPDGTARRRFYEHLVTAPAVDAALDRGLPAGRRAALRELYDHAGREAGSGIVWLIGAGPGAEDLLTLRAQRLLQEADVIVHDQLVPDLVVQMGRRDAERIPVGKAKGKTSTSQSQINGLLVDLAKKGKKVARLKSGDPMIFGRAGEEIAALRSAGITYGIVPGVTAALAASADTATPVTLRGVASGFIVATAHGADNADLGHWASLAHGGVTLGLYMGKTIAPDVSGRLIGEGLDASTPVGIVVNAGRADRSMVAGTLGELSHGAVAMPEGPALILIGEAVGHGDWAGAAAIAEQAEKVA